MNIDNALRISESEFQEKFEEIIDFAAAGQIFIIVCERQGKQVELLLLPFDTNLSDIFTEYYSKD